MTYPHMQMILSAIANLQVNPLPSSRVIAGDANTATWSTAGASDGALVIWRHRARARRPSRLGIGCAEQRFVRGAEVGCGQATGVQLPDLPGYGDGDLDVLA